MQKSYLSELNNLTRPDGSARFCQGNTVIQAGVYGPGKVGSHKELYDEAAVELTYRKKIQSPMSDLGEKLVENILKNALCEVILRSFYPRTLISITLLELQNDGSILSCCVNAACMALLDAGVAMKDTIAAVSAAVVNDGQIICNPSSSQEKLAKGCLTVAFCGSTQEVVTLVTDKKMTQDDVENCVQKCRPVAQDLFTYYRTAATKAGRKEAQDDNDVR